MSAGDAQKVSAWLIMAMQAQDVLKHKTGASTGRSQTLLGLVERLLKTNISMVVKYRRLSLGNTSKGVYLANVSFLAK